ncbi:MAG: DNA-binding protein [Clostridia bacterium]|nr:DNA-binding protein [Clostridia bacterium]
MKNDIYNKSIYISMLLEMYGKLLTERQADIVDLYYNQNLSLAEIGEEFNITKQGVRKGLVEGENKLIDVEEKLGFLKAKERRQSVIMDVIEKSNEEYTKSELRKIL